MKTIPQIILFVFIVSPIFLLSQSDSLLIKKYISPDFDLRVLEIFPAAYQSSASSEGFNRGIFRIGVDGRYSRNAMIGKNNIETFINSEVDYLFEKLNENQTSQENGLRLDLNINTIRDYYFEEKVFFRYGASLFTNYFITTVEDEFDAFPRLTSNVRIPIGIGFGRPYDVTQLWHANTFMEMLGAGPLPEQTITNFADELYRVRWKRVMDRRLRDIDRLEAVYQYISDNDIVPFNPRNAALISDIYRYEAFRVRRRGTRTWFEIAPSFGTNKTPLFNAGNSSLSTSLNFQQFNPINEDWQFDQSISASYTASYIGDEMFTFDEKGTTLFRITHASTVGWYQSLRTFFGLSTAVIYDNYSADLVVDDRFSVNLGFEFEYYVSPAMILEFSGGLGYQKVISQVFPQSSFNQNLRFIVVYRIW